MVALSEKLVPKHNAYGATWSDPEADWLTKEVHAHLGRGKTQLTLEVLSWKLRRELRSMQKSRR